MEAPLSSWLFWALLSAGFAALTAIFAKIGIENVNSDFATLIASNWGRTAAAFKMAADSSLLIATET